MNLGRREVALLCELLVRGPQTRGELKDRAGRMHRFTDSDEVERCLRALSERAEQPFVRVLPKLPGTKEPRWAQLLSGEPSVPEHIEPPQRSGSAAHDRISELEAEMSELRQRILDLEQQFARFKQQFE